MSAAVAGSVTPAAQAQLSPDASTSKPTHLVTPTGPDPAGLAEYSVVYTNRSLNHMSAKFQQVMKDVSKNLKVAYGAHSTALVPGSGTYAMEAVARQFGTGQTCVVLRNGYFSYRWSQIFETGSIPAKEIVLKAQPVEPGDNPAYAPRPLAEVLDVIERERPAAVFAPHVETSSGMILPDEYIKSVAQAVHNVGGVFVLDCIASGCLWVNMLDTGVDVIISAPQKGWSAPPCTGIVCLSKAARERIDATQGTCFAVDLKKWVTLMETYENGGHMYHTTMPTDAIITFRDVQEETATIGFERVKYLQQQLGDEVRQLLGKKGFKSVAAKGFQAPGVVVSYTDNPNIKSGAAMAANGMQISAGVPLMVDDFTQSPEYKSFRLGLFGLDKMLNIKDTVSYLEAVLEQVSAASRSRL